VRQVIKISRYVCRWLHQEITGPLRASLYFCGALRKQSRCSECRALNMMDQTMLVPWRTKESLHFFTVLIRDFEIRPSFRLCGNTKKAYFLPAYFLFEEQIR